MSRVSLGEFPQPPSLGTCVVDQEPNGGVIGAWRRWLLQGNRRKIGSCTGASAPLGKVHVTACLPEGKIDPS